MISKSAVQQAVEEWLEGKEYFLVDISISPDDRIVVEIDQAPDWDSPSAYVASTRYT